MVALLGLLGAILLGGSALPQAIHTVRTQDASSLDWVFLLTWLLGEICLLIYISLTSRDVYLLGNYLFNLACLIAILRVKLKF